MIQEGVIGAVNLMMPDSAQCFNPGSKVCIANVQWYVCSLVRAFVAVTGRWEISWTPIGCVLVINFNPVDMDTTEPALGEVNLREQREPPANFSLYCWAR